MFPHGGPPHWVSCLVCPLGSFVLGMISLLVLVSSYASSVTCHFYDADCFCGVGGWMDGWLDGWMGA